MGLVALVLTVADDEDDEPVGLMGAVSGCAGGGVVPPPLLAGAAAVG